MVFLPSQSNLLSTVLTCIQDADPLYSAYHFSHPILTERLKAIGWTSEKKISKDAPAKFSEKANGEKGEL